ncbi:Variant-specific surface protein, partial [Giardia duodenalis]
VCTADNAVCSAKSNGVCTTCTGSSFMFKGGCYATANAPGNTMCETTDSAGVCTTAKQGYFVPPAADRDNAHQSVIPCGDDGVVTVKDDKQYKGVANCLTCTAPTSGEANTPKAATCDKCADGYFGDACTKCHESCLTCSDAADENSCTACAEGTHFLGAASGQTGKCISCGDASGATWKGVANCAKCNKPIDQSTPAVCIECAEGYYLRTAADGTTTSCVTNCGEGFFPTTVNNIKKCVSCSETSNGGIADCSACTPIESPTTTVLVTCSACSQGKVSPGGSSCLTACPENSSDQSGTCVCSSGFVPSGDKCTSSSANRSALSTGAIAGISVAAVVVVGGLVGFLCWWFICRGKA